MKRAPKPDCPRGPVCYYLGQTNTFGHRTVLFAIGPRRYEYTLTPQQIESVEHLCKISPFKALNFAKRRGTTMAIATTSTTTT